MGLEGLNLRRVSESLGGSVPKTGSSTASSTRRWVDNQAGWLHSINIEGSGRSNGCRLSGAHSRIKDLDRSYVREDPLSGRKGPCPGPGSRVRCGMLKRHTLESMNHTRKGKGSCREVGDGTAPCPISCAC